jgi:di/tricarboxylate transporter
LAAVLGTIGGLPAAVVAIVIPIVAGVARSYGINYFMMAIMANWAAIAAGMSPLSPAGALFRTLAQRAHLPYSPWTLYGIVLGIHAIAALIAFLALGGVRQGAPERAPGHPPGHPRREPSRDTATGAVQAGGAPDQRATGVGAARRAAFSTAGRAYRIASLVAIGLLVVAAVGLRFDIGLSALSLALLLQVVFRPPEKEMLSQVAWSVVLLLAGLLIYLNLLETIGTLRSIQSALHGIGSPIVTMLVLSYITALLSNMDSSTLVVLGAMAPIGLAISSGSAPAVLAVLVTVATATAIISMSPVHIDGSLIIANTPNDDEPHVFRRLIYLTVAISIVIPGLLAVYPIMAGA